jgi:DNA-binding beta-propeller fold protein YncE
LSKSSSRPSEFHLPCAAVRVRRRLYRHAARGLAATLGLAASACNPTGAAPEAESSSRALRASEERERQPAQDYTAFEADPVRPIAVLPESGWVAVTNTPDDYLELFKPTPHGVERCGAVKVGLRPVAVAVVAESVARAELWVVNHVSDSVSVVELDLATCRAEVARTLQVGDEPRDIVVARRESGASRVFLATAHRGQHHPLESARLGSDLITPPAEKSARGLADVIVFDPAMPSAPPEVVNLFSDTPRALAVGDGVVYAASFRSGNRSTAIPGESVTLRGATSLSPLLARDSAGQPIEQGGELLLRPEVVGQLAIEGGLPAVRGSGRCVADPREPDGGVTLLGLCVQTDAASHVQRVLVQEPGLVDPSCQCTSGDGTLQPTTGVIVRFFADAADCGAAFATLPDGSQGCWLDRAPQPVSSPAVGSADQTPPMAWNEQVRFSLPDQDVFAIGVDELNVAESFSGVGTVLFSMAVQPGTGKVFVTNTEANNLTRFEGHGDSSGTTLIGHLHESRITVIEPGAAGPRAVQPVHLNSHIDYSQCCERDPAENADSFAFPTSGVFSEDGARFYFTALGSDKIGSVSASALGADFDQRVARGRGELRDIVLGDDISQPSGPVAIGLDGRRQRLYVTTQFTNELIVIDAETERVIERVPLPSPEPLSITSGRSVFYNARLTSSHGDSACASCHVFGDLDGLSWDLGDPDAETVRNPGPFAAPGLGIADFRSNKGPMSTQTLRGLANHGALHWRGDRTRRFQERAGEQPDVGSLNEASSFGEFDVAIMGLNGNDALLDPALFQAFTDFTLQLTLPPNPIRHLDDSLTSDQAAARARYFGCQSMSDDQFDSRQCVGTDGSLLDVDVATRDCACANNFLVQILRGVPAARRFGEAFRELLTTSFRSQLEAITTNTEGLPAEALERLSTLQSALTDATAALAAADTALAEPGLLSAGLASALGQLSAALGGLLDLSAEHATGSGEALRSLLALALPPDALPPDVELNDVGSLAALLGELAQVAGVDQLALADEAARDGSGFRNLLGGCDLGQTPQCQLAASDQLQTCHGCHTLDPNGNAELGVYRPGFFGTSGQYSFENESQVFKVPHLRNQYQKVGMFGITPDSFFLPESVFGARDGGFFSANTEFTGPQVRGFGFFHDGVVDTLHRFHGAAVFAKNEQNIGGFDPTLPSEASRAACIQRFRQAPSDLFELAAPEVRPFLDLCLASGPLPEACFTNPDDELCRVALETAALSRGEPFLPEIFAESLLPLCFQLGSTGEGGSASGDCYPSGLSERAQMEAFMLVFDSNLKPMVGQQLTLAPGQYFDRTLVPLLATSAHGDCDLAVHQAGQGYLISRPDPAAPDQSLLETRDQRTLALRDLDRNAGAITFTCHPPQADRAEARRAAFARP